MEHASPVKGLFTLAATNGWVITFVYFAFTSVADPNV